MFKQRIKDISIQNWQSSINNSPKAAHYKYFKSQLDTEKYLFIDLSFTCRKALANFRCSSHSLQIEKGRHANVEREYRFCPFCLERNVYTVEDELHFFMLCPLYNDLRKLYFKPAWNTNICPQMFYSIMKTTNTQCLFSVAKFLLSAFELRRSIYGS